MSKHKPLWKAISLHTEDSFTLTYAEIDELLGRLREAYGFAADKL